MKGYGARSLVGMLDCGAVEACVDIELSNISLSGPDGVLRKDAYFECRNAYDFAIDTSPESCLESG